MRKRIYFAAWLASIFITTIVQAQEQNLSVSSLQVEGVNSLKMPENSPSSTHVYGQVRMEGMQYLTPIPESPQLTYSQLLSARLSALKETSWVDMVADISGGTFFTRGQSHIVVHEAYFAFHTADQMKVYLGRKKKDWSEMDRRWQLGLWQPKFAIDALRPEEQGLTGLFLDYNTQNVELVGFVTPVFIPNVGPDIRQEGGSLVADSRWYRTPSRDYDFNNRINNINYELNIPEAAKLAGNGGAGFTGRIGNKEKGPWIVGSIGYLPVNDLILKRKNFKVVSEDKVDVTVSPDVTYHNIYSVDLGYSFEGIKTSVSYLHDEPGEKLPETDWSIQKLEAIKAYSAAVEFSLSNFFTNTLALQLEYLRINGGGIVDITSNGHPDDVTLFDQRMKFTNALSFRIEGQLASIFQRPFVTRFKYLYDYDQRGSLLNTEFLYYPSSKWAVVLGADVLGVQDESYRVSSFLNQFRANDRVYGGLTYVF
ncbi:MAG: transposase [Bdellovibrio sp.]